MGMLGGLGSVLGGLGSPSRNGALSLSIAKMAAVAFEGGGIAAALKKCLTDLTGGLGSIAATLGKPGPKPLLAGLGSGVIEKMLYMAALSGAMKKAGDSAHFNLETHINDLWIKPSQIRQGQPDALKLQDLIGQQQDLSKMISGILQKMHQSSLGVGQSIR